MTPAPFQPYTRCPACGFIAKPSSMEYALAEDGSPDWARRPVQVGCMCCHNRYAITEGDVLPLTAQQSCPRCATVTACPAGAARVRCSGCGVYLTGSGLTGAQCEELRITEGLAAVALRETYRVALERWRGPVRDA